MLHDLQGSEFPSFKQKFRCIKNTTHSSFAFLEELV